MKKLFLLLSFILFIYTTFASDFPFNIERCSADFNGAAYSEKSIICYGTGAVVLQSADQGETWKQYSAAVDTFDILKVKYYNNSYIGVLDKEYMVVSADEGKNWILKPLADKDTVIDFDIGNNNCFVLKSKKIEIYDNNFQSNKIINLPDSNNYTEMFFFSNKLYFPLNNGCLMIFDYASNTFESINFKEKGFSNSDLQLCNIKNDKKGNLYILQFETANNYSIYKSLDSGRVWELIQNDIYPNYQIYNDSVYHISTEYINTKKDFESICLKINSLKLSNQTSDRVFRDISIKKFMILNDTIMLACGSDKFINISKNKGFNWELKCYFQYKFRTSKNEIYYTTQYYQSLNDSIIFLISSNYGRVFKTMDGGCIWLTQKYNPIYMNTYIYSPFYYYFNYGNGFMVGDPNHFVLNDSIITRTNDFGENFNQMKEKYLIPWAREFYMNHPIGNNSNYYFSQSSVVSNYNNIFWYNSVVYELDSTLKFTGNKNNYDSMKIISMRKINDNYAVGIAEETKEPYTIAGKEQSFKNWHYWLISSTDGGFTWERDINICERTNNSMIDCNFSIYNDTAYSFIYSYTDKKYYLYIIDLKTKSIDISDIDTNSTTNTFILSDKLYSTGYGINEINSTHQPLKFINYKSERYKFFTSLNSEQNQNSAYLFAKDIKNRLCFVKLTPKVPTDVVETQTEGNNPYFYSFPPYPIPAKNYVNVKIYWDKYFDMSSAQFSVYNIYGEKVSNGNDITISNSQSYNGELRWDFNSLPAGVYLIKINTKTCQKVIKVLVA